jgi:hypothetical protein
MKNRAIFAHVSATINTVSEIENIKSYLRADENMETKYNIIKQEERIVITDLNLWKILAPVVRIGSVLPSKDMPLVNPIEVIYNT